MKDYKIIQIDESTWRVEDTGVRFFLLTGNDSALLIDSGMNLKNVKAIAESITNKPIKLVNTHSDPDHIGGNCEFPSFMMHEKENYKGDGEIVFLNDSDIIDLGGRTLAGGFRFTKKLAPLNNEVEPK